jgi:hypothetical protein
MNDYYREYYRSLAQSYRQQKEYLTLDRDVVRQRAAELHKRWYADLEPNADDGIPTVEQLESALWEWAHQAVDSLFESAADLAWNIGQDSGQGICASTFDEALNRALAGKPYHLDAFLDEQAEKSEAQASKE